MNGFSNTPEVDEYLAPAGMRLADHQGLSSTISAIGQASCESPGGLLRLSFHKPERAQRFTSGPIAGASRASRSRRIGPRSGPGSRSAPAPAAAFLPRPVQMRRFGLTGKNLHPAGLASSTTSWKVGTCWPCPASNWRICSRVRPATGPVPSVCGLCVSSWMTTSSPSLSSARRTPTSRRPGQWRSHRQPACFPGRSRAAANGRSPGRG